MDRDPTASLELSDADLPRRPRTALIAGALVLVVAGVAGALLLADRSERARKRDVVDGAFADLSTCLVGPVPLGGETPGARVRAIQLAIAESDPKDAGKLAGEWPLRCQPHALGLVKVLHQERLATAGSDDLAARADQLAQKLGGADHAARLVDLGPAVEALWAKAKETGVAARNGKTGLQAPPAPAVPRSSLAELRKVKPLAKKALPITALKRELHRHRDLAFAVADPSLEAPLSCAASDVAPKVVCKKLPAEAVAVGGEPLLQAARDPGTAPIVVFGANASVGAWSTDAGTPVIRGEKFGWAWRRGDGSALTLTYRNEYDRKLKLSVGDASTMLAPPGNVKNENLYYATALVPGFVLWRGMNDQEEVRLFAQALDGAKAGPVQEIGEVGFWWAQGTEPQVQSCHSGEALAVAVRDKVSWHVTVAKGGAWTVPAKIAALSATLTCKGAGATFTATSSHAKADSIRQWHCAHGVCDAKEAALPPVGYRRSAAVDAGVISVVRVGDRGGVHLHVAPIDKLAGSPGALLFDEIDASRNEPWLRTFDLLPMGRAALLVISADEGTWLARVDEDGRVTPLDVER